MRDDIIGQAYFDDLSEADLLSRDEERELIRRYKKEGDLEARNRVIESALKFVVLKARRFASGHDAQHRLISAGNEGLMEAIQHYSLEKTKVKDCKFLSFAYWHITEHMRKQLRSESTIHIPQWRIDARKKIERFIDQHEKDRAELTFKEIAEGIDMKQMSADRIKRLMEEPSVETDSYDENEITLEADVDPEKNVRDDHVSDLLKDKMDRLTNIQRYVIRAYYGFGMEPKTNKAIGDSLNLSHEAVRQIAIKAREKLETLLQREGIESIQDFI